jgi:hypothetical protein
MQIQIQLKAQLYRLYLTVLPQFRWLLLVQVSLLLVLPVLVLMVLVLVLMLALAQLLE